MVFYKEGYFKKGLSLFVLLLISLSVSGCLQVNTTKNTKAIPDGGLFVSLDAGTKWEQRTSVASTGGIAANFSNDFVSALVLDPSDPKTIYYGTTNQGLLYSIDRGVSWQLAISLGQGTVNAIAIDPKNKCNVYVSIRNDLSKTEDCGRTWNTVFTDPMPNILINDVAVDHFNVDNIYLVQSRGDIVKSSNGGKSWQTIFRFAADTKKFFIDPSDSRRMYADVRGKGLQMSDDSGKTWESINQVLVDNKIAGNIVDIKLIKEQANLIFVATPLGILKSTDRGKKWEMLQLLPPKANASITSMAVNAKNVNELYYITNNTFYKSIDGGINWSPKPIPSTKNAKIILIDKEIPDMLYLGMGK